MALGITLDDWTQILNDLGRSITYYSVTKTVNNLGEETTTMASPTTITAVFLLHNNKFNFDKFGVVEVGDAYMFSPLATNVKRYDKITIDGESYYIDNITRRYIAGIAMYDSCTLFKVL